MLAPTSLHAYAQQRSSLRDRTRAVVLALTMVALMALIMIRMGAFSIDKPGLGSRLTAIDVSGDAAARAKAQTPDKQAQVSHPPLQIVPPPQAIIPVTVKPAFIQLSRSEFAASDISKLGQKGPSGGGSGGKVYGPGEGPGGVQLYKAEWVREPYDSELVTYMPRRGAPPGAWATIACQTIDHYHVENCQALSESPLGSGLARGLRQAAWQFLVRPPRIDGKPQIGAWVRIYFSFSKSPKKDTDDTPGEDASGG